MMPYRVPINSSHLMNLSFCKCKKKILPKVFSMVFKKKCIPPSTKGREIFRNDKCVLPAFVSFVGASGSLSNQSSYIPY